MAVVTRQQDRVGVRWDDGHTAEYHYVWLRDNCACPECRHPDAWERLFDTAAMPVDLTPASLEADRHLTVVWPDGHRTALSEEWLRANEYGKTSRERRTVRPRLWDASIAADPPEIGFAEIAAGDVGLLRWLRLIRDYGFSLIRSVPTEPDAVLDLAQRISFIQESNFGRTFHVVSKPDPENLAYTTHKLHAHSDIPNRHSAVNLQFLHCLEFDAAGGESILVDGFEVARRLADDNPEAYELLTTVAVPWRFQDDTTDISNHSPVLRTDSDGRLIQVSFHTGIMAPLDIDPEVMVPFYAAIRAFGQALRDPAVEYAFKMKPGDCQVFDNERVLHGRAEFDPSTGRRHLQGCYVDKDDFRGKLQALERGGADFRRS